MDPVFRLDTTHTTFKPHRLRFSQGCSRFGCLLWLDSNVHCWLEDNRMGLEGGMSNDVNDSEDEVEMQSLLRCNDNNSKIHDPRGILETPGHQMNASRSNLKRHTMFVSFSVALAVLLFIRFATRSHMASSKPHTDAAANSCDCTNPAARCCDRTIFRTHKFGTILLGDMFSPNRRKDAKYRIHTMPTPKNLDYALPTDLDYRHVLVTRNWFDAMVSGYLYHKAGYECVMDYRGNATGQIQHHSKYFDLETHYHLKGWDQDLQVVANDIPPRQNRSFCRYLADESEEIGIKVIMDFGLSRWYKGVVPYYEKAQEAMRQTKQQKLRQMAV